MPEDLDRGAELIEQLLTDRELRARFRADPAAVLEQQGLPELADGLGSGPGALMTLERRESRSSLAGVMVAAAAEGVDVGHLAEHALPRLGGNAAHAMSHLVHKLTHKGSAHRPATPARPSPVAPAQKIAKPAKPELAPAQLPSMARPVHHQPVLVEPASTQPAGDQPVSDQPAGDVGTTHAATGAEAVRHAADAAASAAPVDPLQYPGNDASSQQIAQWMGANAQQAGLPAELPVMAALTESGLRNLDYGDRDSVGFFQMRTSIWNEGPYAGFLQHPELQLKWFISEALSVKRSDPSLADSPSSYGDWVADIERPAAEYRGRYQLQLENAQALLRNADLSGTTAVSSGVARATAPEAMTGHSSAQTAMSQTGAETAATSASAAAAPMARGLQGAQYVQAVFSRNGMKLPDDIGEQFDVGASVPRDALRPGDVVFFGSSNGTASVAGIYAGNGQVTMGSGGHLEPLSQLSSGDTHYLGARRYSEKLLTGASSYARVLPTIKP